MQITVNGQSQSAADGVRLPGLIEGLKLGPRRLAVELNGEIVPKSLWPETQLRDGDKLEIVHAIGGG